MNRELVVIILVFFLTSINAQTIEWKVIAEQRCSANLISIDSSNNILQARSGFANNTIGTYSIDGELISENQVCDLDFVHFSKALASDKAIHLSQDGEFYISQSDGTNCKLVNQIKPDSLDWTNFRILGVNEDQSSIRTVSVGRLDEDEVLVRAQIDLNSFEITRIFTPYEPRLISSRYNVNNNFTSEVYASSNNAMTDRVVVWDNEFQEIISVVPELPPEVFTDSYVTDNNHLIIAGSRERETGFYGLARAYDLSGNIIWDFEFESDESNSFVFLGNIAQKGNKLIIGGITGKHLYDYDALVLSVNENTGEINWDLSEHIQGEGDGLNDIAILDDGNIIVSGTSGLTDYGGPERAFIFKIEDIVSAVHNEPDIDISIYPNPTNNLINIDSKVNFESIEIVNIDGQNIGTFPFRPSIDVSHLTPGIYFLKLKSDGKMVFRKIILN